MAHGLHLRIQSGVVHPIRPYVLIFGGVHFLERRQLDGLGLRGAILPQLGPAGGPVNLLFNSLYWSQVEAAVSIATICYHPGRSTSGQTHRPKSDFMSVFQLSCRSSSRRDSAVSE